MDTPTVIRVQRRIEAGHPAFDGHFPAAPLLPGVVLLSEVLAAAGTAGWAAPLQIASAKFLSPVRPGSTITIELIVQARQQTGPHGGEQSATFDVRCDDRCVASGRLTRQTAA